MNKGCQILLILLICLSPELFSQKCQGLYETGDRFINESKNGKVCFSREVEKKLDNIYFTKYIFSAEGGKEIYYLEFSFFSDLNKISIKYTNQTGESQLRDISIDPGSSTALFKDYQTNDTTINRNDFYSILFSFSEEPQKPFVILYHFQLMDNETVTFRLKEVNEEKIIRHTTLATNFFLRNIISSQISKPKLNIPTKPSEIPDLRREMDNYRDSILKEIEKEDVRFIEKIGQKEADFELSKRISSYLNVVFYGYLKNVFPYADHNSRVELNFINDADGRNLVLKSFRSINSPHIKWLEDSVRIYLLPILKQNVFETMTVKMENQNLANDFNKIFGERIDNLDKNRPGAMEIEIERKKIYDEFKSKSERVRKIPTAFTYAFNYQSILKYETWQYKLQTRKKEGAVGPIDSNELPSEDLLNLFKTRVNLVDKKTKYKIKRCEVIINDEKPVHDLRQTE